MEQPARAVGFREVDQDGNPITEEVHSAVADDSTGPRSFAFNPFIVILWLLAALLLGGGLAALLNANLALGPSSGAVPLAFVVFTLAPHAILGGVIAVIGLLLWHATQWQRRRG
jgi:hypothetical protein